MGNNYGTENNDFWGYPSFETSTTFESFSDFNLNGLCDYDEHSGDYEPFIDEDASDTGVLGKCDDDNDWTSRCPIENKNCFNVVVVEPGYRASNYTEPSYFPKIEFIIPDSNLANPFTNKTILNRGNGTRYYNVVNEEDLTGSLLRFEINAGLDPDSYGDINGSFSTLEPKLYIYEIHENLEVKNVENYPIDQFSADSLQIVLNLPGVIADDNFISIPLYKLDGFSLLGVDNPQFSSHYSEWFDGVQFRFDNGPNRFTNNLQLVELKSVQYSDTLLSHFMTSKMRYKALGDLSKRLMYKYRVEFSSSFVETAIFSQGDCPDGFYTQLPFKVTNINTGHQVSLEHNDGGIQIGEIKFGERTLCPASMPSCGVENQKCFDDKCRKLTGWKNCQWEYNELIVIVDSVYTTNPPSFLPDCRVIDLGDSEVYKCEQKVFDLKIGFNKFPYLLKYIPNYFQMDGTIAWCIEDDDGECIPIDKNYVSGDFEIYEEMIYVATKDISETINPALWYDDTGDNINDNPWEMKYPWNDGDSVVIEPYGWYQDGDGWVADLSSLPMMDKSATQPSPS
jgi:hypothetical protein